VPLERLEWRLVGAGGSSHGLQRSFARAGSFSRGIGGSAGQDQGYAQQPGASNQGLTQVSASFPGAGGYRAAAAGRRRPLPGAPVRRASSASVEQQAHAQNQAARRGSEQSRGLAGTTITTTQVENQHQQQERQQEEDTGYHGRRQSIVDGATRGRAASDADGGAPFRLIHAAGDVDDGTESGDDGRRGGAASGLLSLARS
jgi:hypothetical protein